MDDRHANGHGMTWDDQSRTYGEQYHDVYHHFFPAGPGQDIARSLAARAEQVASDKTATVVELGVGTGRVAHPMVTAGVDVFGIDSSPELLAVARRDAPDPSSATGSLELEVADIRSWSPHATFDLAACVCATISMFASDAERESALRTARKSIRDRGVVIVETHDPRFVAGLHDGHRQLDFEFPADGLSDVVGRSILDGSNWSVDFEWPADGRRRRAAEHSRLLEPGELTALAEQAGLKSTGLFETWNALSSHDAVDATSGTQPTYIIEFESAGAPT